MLSAILNLVTESQEASSEVIQDLTYTAVTPGAAGNNISIEYDDPGAPDSPLSVSVSGLAIIVSLETDSGSLIISTADDVEGIVNGDPDASALVSAAVSGTGSNVQAAQVQTFLEGGSDTQPYNQPVTAIVTISNSGGSDVTLRDLRPIIGDNSGSAQGVWGPPINPLSIPAGDSAIETFNFIPFSPQVVPDSSLVQLSYSVSCNLQTSDGSSFAPASVVLTVSPPSAN